MRRVAVRGIWDVFDEVEGEWVWSVLPNLSFSLDWRIEGDSGDATSEAVVISEAQMIQV